MNMLIVILIIVALIILFFMFGGRIDWSVFAEKEPEKDYILTPKPTEETVDKGDDHFEEEEVRETLWQSVKTMTLHGEKVGTDFVQPYSAPSLTAQALRYEALAKYYGA